MNLGRPVNKAQIVSEVMDIMYSQISYYFDIKLSDVGSKCPTFPKTVPPLQYN